MKAEQQQSMNGVRGLMSGLGLGATLMYFLDAGRGARRRALVRDKLVRTVNVAGDAAGTALRDTSNRARGIAAEARTRLWRNGADDRVIEARVRSELGRIVSHPGAIFALVEDGHVTLAGDVLASEVERLMDVVGRVRGVTGVTSQLRVHETGENVPALQGGAPRTGQEPEFLQDNWSPAARLVAGVAGGGLTLLGLRRRGPLGSAIGLMGLALLARGGTNRPLRRVVGVGGGRRAINVQKTITIDAPVEQVWSHLTHWERLPEWMSHVREVRSSGVPGTVGERTHWVVDGPAGTTVSWEAETTRLVQHELVAWKSVEGSPVHQAGIIEFDRNDDGSTRVQVQLTYNPPAGAIGHAFAALFSRDPKKQMDDDLARLKTYIETGRAPHDAAQPTSGNGGASA